MKDNERPNLKQIRIKRSVCDRLDEHKGKDDSYTDVVKELLDENERLTSRCEELQHDKAGLTNILLLISRDAQVKSEMDELTKQLIDDKLKQLH